MDSLQSELAAGIQALGLTLEPEAQQRLLEFLHLLQKWNRAYNLTAIDTLPEMITHHVLDSLAIAPYVKGARILDAGTGAGFPGIPLALYYPNQQFVLLDSVGKKIRFLQQAITQFKFDNVTAVQERMEKFVLLPGFDVIICRALGKIQEVMSQTEHLLNANGQWLFMKGVYPATELEQVSQAYVVHKINIPNIAAERHIIVVDKKE